MRMLIDAYGLPRRTSGAQYSSVPQNVSKSLPGFMNAAYQCPCAIKHSTYTQTNRSKVNQLHVKSQVEDHVFVLDVAVHDAALVQVLNRRDKLPEDVACNRLVHLGVLVDEFKQIKRRPCSLHHDLQSFSVSEVIAGLINT